MQKAIPVSEYILLGEAVCLSINPGVMKPANYSREIQKLFACLKNCEFEAAHTAALPVDGKTMYTRPDGMLRDDYEDFYSIKPPLNVRSVLDAMRAAGQLTGGYDKLCHYLGERNRYAHANNLVPSLHQTNHYIEDLMDLITNAPFA